MMNKKIITPPSIKNFGGRRPRVIASLNSSSDDRLSFELNGQHSSSRGISGRASRQFTPTETRIELTETSETKSVKSRVAKETKGVRKWRKIVRGILVFMAIITTTATALYINRRNYQDFANKYNDMSMALEEAFFYAGRSVTLGMNTFADSVTAYGLGSDSHWPFVTVPFFDIHARNALLEAKGDSIAVFPLVYERDRDAWNYYSSKYYQISLNHSSAGTTTEEPAITPYIFENGMDGSRIPAEGKDVYAPTWQAFPPVPGRVNYNFLSTDLGKDYLQQQQQRLSDDRMDSPPRIAMSHIVVTPPTKSSMHTNELTTAFLRPLYKGFSSNLSMVGLLGLEYSWDNLFNNLLPESGSADGLFIVLHNTCNQTFSYSVMGNSAIYLGEGDLHNTEYDAYGSSIEFLSKTFVPTAGAGAAGEDDRGSDFSSSSSFTCTYWIHMYPSDRLRRSGESWMDRRILPVVTVLIFLIIGITFFMYDRYVGKRNKKIMKHAATSNKVLGEIYPKMIRDRLLERDDTSNSNNEPKRHSSAKTTKTNTDHNNRDNILGGGSQHYGVDSDKDILVDTGIDLMSSSSNSSSSRYRNSNNNNDATVIADLYPAATILFGDIVGFTAWSSVREPTQVFELLEALFQAFDEIAEMRGVFKVETVGDCYVAATGLPDPRKDHAVVMVKFARDCLYTMRELFRELEVTLGPETSDLSMRFGLHSGSITAGVLRGKGARFQLFGDTMNTASRIETTGARGRVHLSQATADLLIEANKSKWIQRREDKVVAKGKGEMTTYWLIVKNDDESETSYHTSGSLSENNGDVVAGGGDNNNNNDGGGEEKKVELGLSTSTSLGSIEETINEDETEFDSEYMEDDDKIRQMVPMSPFQRNQIPSQPANMRNSYFEKRYSLNSKGTSLSSGQRSSYRRSFHNMTPPLEEEESKSGGERLSPKMLRLIDWMVDVMCRILIRIDKSPSASSSPSNRSSLVKSVSFSTPNTLPPRSLYNNVGDDTDSEQESSSFIFLEPENNTTILEEVKESIRFPEFNAETNTTANNRTQLAGGTYTGMMKPSIVKQLREYVTEIASLHKNDNPFHNFEHASHVTMSVVKLLARLVSLSDGIGSLPEQIARQMIHVNTFGISSDPLAQFAALFAALIHDVDHPGICNEDLVTKKTENALRYKNRCISEQNSMDVAWKLLMEPRFSDLRSTISSGKATELHRFRQILVNSLIATDLHDKELNGRRDERWRQTFGVQAGSGGGPQGKSRSFHQISEEESNRRGTLILEYLLQVSDVSHMMQHWDIYRKWNALLFQEIYFEYKNNYNSGGVPKKTTADDPSEYWYGAELDFFDQTVIPLCEKIKSSRIFGVSASELLSYAKENRKTWEQRGTEEVAKMLETAKKKYEKKNSSSSSLVAQNSFHGNFLNPSFMQSTSLLAKSLPEPSLSSSSLQPPQRSKTFSTLSSTSVSSLAPPFGGPEVDNSSHHSKKSTLFVDDDSSSFSFT